MTEEENAIETLTQSEQYISETACTKMVQSIVSDFQWTLNIALYKLILSKMEDPESFLDVIKNQWQQRAQHVLNEDRKRFQDTIIKATVKDDKKLTDSFAEVLNNYTRTIETAYTKSESIVDDLIKTLLNKKETQNDK